MGKYLTTGYREGDEKTILELFERVYGRKISPDAWKWRFFDNPYENRRMISVWTESGRLAAHTGVTVFEGCRDQKKIRCAYSGHTMADRDFPGISRLMLTRLLETSSDIDLLYAFPNNNSFRIFKDIMHFEYLGDVPFWICGTEPGMPIPEGIREIPSFHEEHGELYRKLIESHEFVTVRDLTRLNWRIMKKPDSGYHLFELRDGGILKGYLVLNRFTERGVSQGQIIDVAAADPESMERMLCFARGYFGNAGLRMVKLWMTSGHFEEALRRQGFSPDRSRVFPMVMSGGRFCLSEMYITMVDSDVF